MIAKIVVLLAVVTLVAIIVDTWVNYIQHPEDRELQYEDE